MYTFLVRRRSWSDRRRRCGAGGASSTGSAHENIAHSRPLLAAVAAASCGICYVSLLVMAAPASHTQAEHPFSGVAPQPPAPPGSGVPLAAPLATPLAAPYARGWPPTPGAAPPAAVAQPAVRPSGRACVAGVCCFGPRVDGYCFGQWGRIRSVFVYKGCCAGSWLLCLLIFASVFLPLGVGFLAALGVDERAAKIAAFNAASAAWGNASQSFSGLTNLTVSGDGGTVALAQVTTLDVYPDADGLVLPTVGLHYAGQSGSPSSPVAGANFDGIGGSPTSGSQSAGHAGAAPVANGWAAKRFYQRTTCSSTKYGSSCNTNYWRLSGFCFVIDANLASAGGCALDDTADGLSIAEMTKCDGSGYFTFSVPVDVRSPDDPYVNMMRATNGSKNFGISQAAKVICGAVFLAAGVVICAGGCLCLRCQPAPPKAAYAAAPAGQHFPGDAAISFYAPGAAPRGAAAMAVAGVVPYAIPVSYAPGGGGAPLPGAPYGGEGTNPGGAPLFASALSPYGGAPAHGDAPRTPAQPAGPRAGVSI